MPSARPVRPVIRNTRNNTRRTGIGIHPMSDATGVFLDLDTIDRGDLDLSGLHQACPEWRLYGATAPEAVCERLRGASLVVSNKVVLDRTALATTGLRLVCIAATGANNLDLAAARERGIAVSNVTGYATAAVLQHVFALILALTTRLPGYQRLVRAGNWQRSAQFCLLDLPIREISGRTLGIVGYGELGRAVARMAEAFGMQVLVAQRPGGPKGQPERLALEELLPRVDVLSLHCPLADNTRDLIGEQELALMKDDALLINTARGGIVDEAALARALRDGCIGGAGVDVLREEPPPDGNPLLAPDVPNLIVTPHIAWASRESRQRLLNEIAENIRAFTAGRPRNRLV